MKRLISIITILTILIMILSGCTVNEINKVNDINKNLKGKVIPTDGLSIVCTIFPLYDWVSHLLGDMAEDIELIFLMDNRVDLHSYQPSLEDIVKILESDLFIYIGGESDNWAEDVLSLSNINPDMVIIDLLEILDDAVKLGMPIAEIKGVHTDDGDSGQDDHGELMRSEHDHDDNENHDDHDYDDHSEHDHDYGDHNHNNEDEHVWLSLKNAQLFCQAIVSALSLLDVDNTDKYNENLALYLGSLSALDLKYHAAVDAAPGNTLLFADRFPFRYLLDDYNLNYYAAFSGCSAETEASFSTIVFLADKINELSLSSVLVTESADQSIAKTIIANTADKDQQILVLDAMQSVTLIDVRNQITYLSIMENNLQVLKEALK